MRRASAAATDAGRVPHIVDQLIEERAERLRRVPGLWPVLRPLLYPLLDYPAALRMADTIAPLSGLDALRHLSHELALKVQCDGLEYVPREGPAVLTPNHPSGIADGIALFDALVQVRQDISIFANRDAIRVAPGFADVIVPVEWMEQRRNTGRRRETVRGMVDAFRNGRLVVIFPSGRLARPTLSGLVEREWQPSAVSLAQRYRAPIVPVYMDGRNSWLYYLFYAIHSDLRDMTLFRELLNKRGRTYRIRFGEGFIASGEPAAVTRRLREFVVTDMPRGGRRFESDAGLSPARKA